jgi:hypothetical protein
MCECSPASVWQKSDFERVMSGLARLFFQNLSNRRTCSSCSSLFFKHVSHGSGSLCPKITVKCGMSGLLFCSEFGIGTLNFCPLLATKSFLTILDVFPPLCGNKTTSWYAMFGIARLFLQRLQMVYHVLLDLFALLSFLEKFSIHELWLWFSSFQSLIYTI